MTATEKRNEKRLAKLYGRLATACLIFWVLEWVAMIIVRNNTVGEWKISFFLLISFFLAPIFASLVFWTISGTHTGNLQRYKRRIKEFRVRRAFQKFMEYIILGDLDMAIRIYNGYIPVKHQLRDYCYSVLIVLMSQSDDPELKKRGEEKIATLLNFYDPSKITF